MPRVSWWPETRLEWAFFSATAIQAFVNITIQRYTLSPNCDYSASIC